MDTINEVRTILEADKSLTSEQREALGDLFKAAYIKVTVEPEPDPWDDIHKYINKHHNLSVQRNTDHNIQYGDYVYRVFIGGNVAFVTHNDDLNEVVTFLENYNATVSQTAQIC